MTHIALVTGSSRGIGKSIALKLAASGIDLIITYRTGEREARGVVEQIQSTGRRAAALPLDVGKSATFPAFADALKAQLEHGWARDRFDYLVNNAGVGQSAPFMETTEAQFDELSAVHLKGTFFLSQRLLPLVVDGGRIINISSGLTRYSYPGHSAYAAMKAGVDVLTRYMAVELGPRRILVNVVAPGGIETDFGGGVMRDPALQAAISAQTASGRVGVPDDVGGVVAMLLAGETQWINGQRIELTGGFML